MCLGASQSGVEVVLSARHAQRWLDKAGHSQVSLGCDGLSHVSLGLLHGEFIADITFAETTQTVPERARTC